LGDSKEEAWVLCRPLCVMKSKHPILLKKRAYWEKPGLHGRGGSTTIDNVITGIREVCLYFKNTHTSKTEWD